MKVLYLTPGCFDKGGISRYSRYQILALRRLFDSRQVRVLSLLGPMPGDFETPFSIYWHGTGNGLWQKLTLIIQLVRQLMFWRPDVLHVAHVNFSGVAFLLGRVFGVRQIVLNVYGLEVWSGLTWDAALGLRKVDSIISDCHFTAQYLIDEGWRVKEDITVIWDCVDLDQFQPRPENWARIQEQYELPDRDEHFIIMTLGRLAFADKGYDRLIRVFAKVITQHPKARLVIGGKGNMRKHLEQLIAAENLGPYVTFTGMVPDEDLASLYSYAHLFSLVSDRGKGRGEGIPLTPLEAMACHVPIIVGNHDGSQEAVIDDLNGTIVDPFDLEAHSNAIIELITSSSLQQSKAYAARQIAKGTFSFELFTKKHEAFFTKHN